MNEQKQGRLTRIVIKGFKSIKNCELELNDINVLIGSNGAGKSNFISIFEMLQKVLAGELIFYTEKKGINPLLYSGKEATDSILAEFHFGTDLYSFELEWTENDNLFFREERVYIAGQNILLDGGYRESKALTTIRKASDYMDIPQIMLEPQWRIYQFRDTGLTSRMKSEHNISNCNALMWDASNLAAFLYRLREHYPAEYHKIIRAIQRVAPFFKDFELKPKEGNNEQIVLRWIQNGYDGILIPSQLSDGTLRFVCLATLLLQPTELQPATIIIDEPELGLHPYAITILAELVKKVATKKQIVLATQSVELFDHFEAEDVIVVDRGENGSEFKRLDMDRLAIWLEDDYTLGELWNKNIFGGRISTGTYLK